jgi:hypothetical protein
MSPELEKKLVSEFPSLFRGVNKPKTESLMCYGCAHDDGWFDIIYSMCKAIDNHVRNSKEPIDYKFTQIKEKFGILRVYGNGGDEFISGVIRMAEQMSSSTCEYTGRPGKLRSSGVWLKTLCEEEAIKVNYQNL